MGGSFFRCPLDYPHFYLRLAQSLVFPDHLVRFSSPYLKRTYACLLSRIFWIWIGEPRVYLTVPRLLASFVAVPISSGQKIPGAEDDVPTPHQSDMY